MGLAPSCAPRYLFQRKIKQMPVQPLTVPVFSGPCFVFGRTCWVHDQHSKKHASMDTRTKATFFSFIKWNEWWHMSIQHHTFQNTVHLIVRHCQLFLLPGNMKPSSGAFLYCKLNGRVDLFYNVLRMLTSHHKAKASMSSGSCACTRFLNSFTLGMAFCTAASQQTHLKHQEQQQSNNI